MKKKITIVFAYLVYAFVYLISLLPMPILYFFSDVAYLIAYYIIGYRKSIIIQNLSRAFPNKKYQEINEICHKNTRHLMSVFTEMLKYFSASEKYHRKHLTIANPEILDKYYDANRNIFFILGHYANWEQFTAVPIFLNKYPFYGLYKKQKSELSNMLSYKMRTRFNSQLIAAKESVRYILGNKNNPSIYAFIGDQSSPPATSQAYMFLNQPTYAYAGAEKLSKPLNAAVLYLEMIPQKKRGYYVAQLTDMTGSENITEDFLGLLEKTIDRAPEYWLWSHKRWKHTVLDEAFNRKGKKEEKNANADK